MATRQVIVKPDRGWVLLTDSEEYSLQVGYPEMLITIQTETPHEGTPAHRVSGGTWMQSFGKGKPYGKATSNNPTSVVVTDQSDSPHWETKTETRKINTVKHETKEIQTDTLKEGERKVTKAGSDGYTEVTEEVTLVDGVETLRTEKGRKKILPVTEEVQVGTGIITTETDVKHENTVKFTSSTKEVNTRKEGEKKTTTAGKDGYDEVTYAVTFKDGVEQSRKETGRKTVKPVNEVVELGTGVITTRTETAKENTVKFKTTHKDNPDLEKGKSKTTTKGVDGYDDVTYTVTLKDGVEQSRKETGRKTVKPVDEVIEDGTKEPEDAGDA